MARSSRSQKALQDTFLRAHLAIRSFEGRSTIYSWLTRIAMNSALMILRKRRTRQEVLFDSRPDDMGETVYLEIRDRALDPEANYELCQRRVLISRAIRRLNPHLREPLRMRMAQDTSLKEIGRVLNISEGAVKARLHRARRRLSIAFQAM